MRSDGLGAVKVPRGGFAPACGGAAKCGARTASRARFVIRLSTFVNAAEPYLARVSGAEMGDFPGELGDLPCE